MSGFPNSATDAELEARAKELLSLPPPPPVVAPSKGFKITDTPEYYTIEGVVCDNSIYSVNWLKCLLANRSERGSNGWVEYNSSYPNEYIVAPSNLQICIIKALCENNASHFKDIIEQIRFQFLSPALQSHWMATSTRVQYSSTGPDRVIHDYWLPGNKVIHLKINGKTDLITNIDDEITQALFSCNSRDVTNISQWVCGNDARLSLESNIDGERSVSLGSDGRFDISACASTDNKRRAFGIRILTKVPIGGAQ